MRQYVLRAALVLAGAAPAVGAQAAHYAPLAARLPASTRALGMGDAGVAMADVGSIFYNPAFLANVRAFGIAAQRYGSASTLATMSATMNLAPGGLGVGVQALDYGASCAACLDAVPVRDAPLFSRGPAVASEIVGSIGFGRDVAGTRLGAAAKYVEERLPNDRDGAAVVDVGAARNVGPVVVGLAFQNLGNKPLRLSNGRRPLPLQSTVGGAVQNYAAGPLDLSASASLSALEHGELSGGGGAEASYTPLEGYSFAARAGARGASHETALTAGASFSTDRFSIDYALEHVNGAGTAHRVGLRWR